MLTNATHADWDEADNDTRPAIATLHTDGSGYWSRFALPVQITELEVTYINDAGTWGELRVHFNTDSWRPDKHGLIYTDNRFKQELRTYANSIGLAGGDIEYSEQGMQGENFVSLDVSTGFLASWQAKYPEKYAETKGE